MARADAAQSSRDDAADGLVKRSTRLAMKIRCASGRYTSDTNKKAPRKWCFFGGPPRIFDNWPMILDTDPQVARMGGYGALLRHARLSESFSSRDCSGSLFRVQEGESSPGLNVSRRRDHLAEHGTFLVTLN